MNKQSRRPLGPLGFPFIGQTLEFLRSPTTFLTSLQRRYGDIARFRMNGKRYFLLSNPTDIRNFLMRDFASFEKTGMFVKMRKLMGNGLLTCPFADHKRQRRIIQPAFSQSALESFGATMPTVIESRIKGWYDGEDLDLTTELDRMTLAIAAQVLLGEDLVEDARVREYVDLLVKEFSPKAMTISSFWPSWLPSPHARRLRKVRNYFEGVAMRMIGRRKQAIGSGKNIMSLIIDSLLSDAEPPAHAYKEATDQIITLLLSGHETVATSLGWTFALLAKNPQAAARLREELDAVLNGQTPTMEDLPKLVYTEMVIKESMRIFPAAWAINRVALADYKVGDVVIPKGSNVSVNAFVTHRDPRFYADPMKFDPLRWTPDEEAKRPDLCYFPFGAGARGCIGGGFAMMEMKFILAAVLQKWDVKLKPGQTLEHYPHVTLRPKQNILVTLTERLPESKEVAYAV